MIGESAPECDTSACFKTMIAFSGDKTECGIMAECSTQAQALIESSGGILCTRASLSDIYNFPTVFAPMPRPL